MAFQDVLELGQHQVGRGRHALPDPLADLLDHFLCAGQVLGCLFGFERERGRQLVDGGIAGRIDEPHRAGQGFELQPHQADRRGRQSQRHQGTQGGPVLHGHQTHAQSGLATRRPVELDIVEQLAQPFVQSIRAQQHLFQGIRVVLVFLGHVVIVDRSVQPGVAGPVDMAGRAVMLRTEPPVPAIPRSHP
ncbi:MAG: hypothetical protein R3E56_05460 [Burkholderiaceae bacterium]